jgi:predicted RNA-binding protein with TRAM domain|tara:strand:+ start:358 stop:699 length:342 start_codon:yes stop_codon:yes gene_type:complete
MYDQDRNFSQGDAPVNVGDEIDVKIEAVGEKGDGIAKKEGFVLFVPNTKEGQEVKIKITKVLRKVGFAEVVGEAAPKQEGTAESAPAEQNAAAEEPEQKVEDTEDFGEEEKKE